MTGARSSSTRADAVRPPRVAPRTGLLRATGCVLLAAFFLAAGILHFRAADEFAKIVPPFLPLKREIVLLSGAAEIVLASWLLVPLWRRAAGLVLSAYLLAVLPANVWQALARVEVAGIVLPDWLAWTRVALQFPLIAFVLAVTRMPPARTTPGDRG